MIYAEQVYFEGAHFAHIARYLDHQRLLRLRPTRPATRRHPPERARFEAAFQPAA